MCYSKYFFFHVSVAKYLNYGIFIYLFQSSSFWETANKFIRRRLMRAVPRQITTILQADVLWNIGIRGKLIL